MWIVYKTTNKVNQNYYIGVHKGSDNRYLGSGTRFRSAVKHHGKSAFERKILYTFDNEHSALNCERILVDDLTLQDPKCYNLTFGGSMPPSQKGIPKSPKFKRLIGEAQKRSWASGNRTGRKHSEDFKDNMRLNNPSKRPEVKAKQSSSRKEYLATLTPERRIELAQKSAETRRLNKQNKAES